jgi:hypothetical protein
LIETLNDKALGSDEEAKDSSDDEFEPEFKK